MNTQKLTLLGFTIILFTLLSCTEDPITQDPQAESMYFPTATEWESKTAEEAGFNTTEIPALLTYLEDKNTKGFILLHNGKIVIESYFNGHEASSYWYWASAGKTLTATLTGIAQQENLLEIDQSVSSYLGNGWTSATLEQEQKITCKNLLTMTSGLDDSLGDSVSPENLQYIADAGTRWAYHNVYVKLQDVVASVSGTSWSDYFNTKIKTPLGMDGAWFQIGDLNVYYSTTRSMARFGLLALAKGTWENQNIINETFFTASVNTSQNLNLSYGYLWWLNGKSSYKLPQSQWTFDGSLIPNAPTDMFAALGKNDQKIYVIPSKKIVIIRMGEEADTSSQAVTSFDNELWGKINAVINN